MDPSRWVEAAVSQSPWCSWKITPFESLPDLWRPLSGPPLARGGCSNSSPPRGMCVTAGTACWCLGRELSYDVIHYIVVGGLVVSNISRRNFTIFGSASLLLAALRVGGSRAEPLEMPVGLQLYTIYSELEKDLEGTLSRIAALGIREVELLDFPGRKPKDCAGPWIFRDPAPHQRRRCLRLHHAEG